MAYDNKYTAQKLRRWENYLRNFQLPEWKDIPDFGLYMEQVTALLQQFLDYFPPELKEEQFITASTINNYVRMKIMPGPVKKKYYRKHIAYLLIILTLKQSLSMALIQSIIQNDLSEDDTEKLYTSYAGKHAAAISYFTKQVAVVASPILHDEERADIAAEKTEDLIITSAVISGFARLLAEKLLLLKDMNISEK